MLKAAVSRRAAVCVTGVSPVASSKSPVVYPDISTERCLAHVAAGQQSPRAIRPGTGQTPGPHLIALAAFVGATSLAYAGPYSPMGGMPGSDAVAASDSRIVAWATSVESIQRGPRDINNPTGSLASFGLPTNALGPAKSDTFTVVSLGDGGSITLGFALPIRQAPGPDFVVFENGFPDAADDTRCFCELAYVEVSSDGKNFFRFPSVSLTPTDVQVGAFDTIDPTDIHNLAGRDPAGWGTAFDLDDLVGTPGLDLMSVRYVRLIDVVGRITPAPNNAGFTPSLDSLGNIINDPYATAFSSGGFDLDAVGVLHVGQYVPEPTNLGLLLLAGATLARRHRNQNSFPKEREMQRKNRFRLAATGLVLTGLTATAHANTATFEDLPLPANSYDLGPSTTGNAPFTSGGVTFDRVKYIDPDFGYEGYYGFVPSSKVDPTTPGYRNQYAAYAGSGADNSANYTIYYGDDFSPSYYNLPTAYIELPQGQTASSVQLTNTTYTALSIRNGDGFTRKFGGPSGTLPDYFTVTFTGYTQPAGAGDITGTVNFTLADYRFDNPADDYIVSSWKTLDLSPLGNARSIGLSFYTTVSNDFGPLTPYYVALDNLTVIPEPASLTLLAPTLLTLRRRR
jgi:hypothetical protein